MTERIAVMEYVCSIDHEEKTFRCNARIHLLQHYGDTYEAEISGRGCRFHVIVGAHAYGHYICIPNIVVGSELADPEDVLWNYELPAESLDGIDAVTVSEELKYLGKI